MVRTNDNVIALTKGESHYKIFDNAVSSPYASYNQEVAALDKAFEKMVQIPYYDIFGPNSNTFARQLLENAGFKTASLTEWRDISQGIPMTVDRAPSRSWLGLSRR